MTPVDHDRRVSVLVVEDDEQKYEDVSDILRSAIMYSYKVTRASTAREAEKSCLLIRPDLLLLDISMNISPGSMGPLRGGFANLGGLDILNGLYLSGATCETIIITGFDLFKSSESKQSAYQMVGLQIINDLAKKKLGDKLLACIRYQSPGWEDGLATAIANWKPS